MEGFFSAALGGILDGFEDWTGKENDLKGWCKSLVDVNAQDNFVVG